MVVDKYQDDEDLDPAKRMRFTPQPPTVISSSATEDAEITRISDSMPGTATDEQSLQQRLAYAEEAYRNEREARRAGETHFREQEERWDERQTEFENLSRDYRLLLGKQQTVENKLETVTKNNNTLRERLATRTSEMKELAEANEAKERALSAAKTAEASEDYLKASRSDAQDKAAESVTKLNELEARMPQLELAASGEATKRKAMHLKKVYDQQDKQIKNLRAELAIVKRTLQSKEDELTRLKSTGRMGVGTRGTSTTPQPKIRSRAGSPILGGRIGTLRSG
jgi:chromosome segregation ATPase